MIWYRRLRGYKYQTTRNVAIALRHIRSAQILEGTHGYVVLDGKNLAVSRGYAWDGASGPTLDTESTMRASLAHDALYQLMREGLLSQDLRTLADLELRDLAVEDGMGKWRAWLWVKALGLFGSL